MLEVNLEHENILILKIFSTPFHHVITQKPEQHFQVASISYSPTMILS